ncbi:peptidoglycan DD-metalloendopeptidase family protein [Fonticella tunisiensis]|uniref:Murein DD-endopeptidase MepM/ murein hydrolase activator NlpD n=1 Tax=Fonticella tunisiensis TaxID=1096341 RepID=A0A4R7KT40_9CLOT|nr:peptidoglycan DD-metalloendopeptidase family protein [Fonticella tunisiensis]TDT63248.1 murein DD-endopeptidase MepM/ murein hydrolase activator NlpD [Fonticella tunisiensis]
MNKPTEIFYAKISSIIRKIRQKIGYSVLLGTLFGLAVTVMVLYIYIKSHTVYIVKINNNSIGYVQNLETFNEVIEKIKSTDGIDITQSVTAEKTRDVSSKLLSSYEIERIARQSLKLKMPAVAMYANGEEVVKLPSKEDVDKVLEKVKQNYIPQYKDATVSILSSKIKENIETKDTLANPSEVLDINGAVQKIMAGKNEQKKYVVQQGDTIWDIALKNDVEIEDIQEANPDIDLDKIKINQEIKLNAIVPYINIEIEAAVSSDEQIPFETKTITDKNLARGTTKVKQEGKYGLAHVEKKITLLNNSLVKEEVLKNNIITAAVDKVVVTGSKAPTRNYSGTLVASAASGRFGWPSRGQISSGFGRRWGRLHTGVDIRTPVGTPVAAADSGTVTFAGWNGSYGYLVKISHGNGYETLYAHNSKLLVSPGQMVSKGQKISLSGNTGRSTGPHVHFEVRKNGVPQNPLSYLK